MNKEVNVRSPGGSSRENMRGNVEDVKERGDAYCDQTSAQKMESRDPLMNTFGGSHLGFVFGAAESGKRGKMRALGSSTAGRSRAWFPKAR